jgi:hypothetical protein
MTVGRFRSNISRALSINLSSQLIPLMLAGLISILTQQKTELAGRLKNDYPINIKNRNREELCVVAKTASESGNQAATRLSSVDPRNWLAMNSNVNTNFGLRCSENRFKISSPKPEDAQAKPRSSAENILMSSESVTMCYPWT